MGLREGRPSPGLAALLEASPPRDQQRLNSVWAARLAGSLGEAVAYVVGSGAAAAAAPPDHARLVSDGHINLEAVSQHVRRAVAAAASGEHAVAGEPQQDSQPPAPGGGEQAGAHEAATAGLAEAGLAEAEGPPPLVPEEGGSSGSDGEPPGLAQGSGEPGSPAASGAAAAAPAPPPPPPAGSGRLGPEAVTLVEARGTAEINGCFALSRTNFATVRSSVCVFRGRWMYEVQLGSAGIMQLGWTTLGARFNSEEGVGDTHDSFAYDGRRRMRWHVSNYAYGEYWAAGDVIGCCVDLDAGTMRFYRNGRDLGEAFTNVRRGMPGAAYFAGVSLSFSERCEVNFGGRPFTHPVEGYQPLQGYQTWEPQQAQQAQQAQQQEPQPQPQQGQQGVEEAPLAAGAPTQEGQLAAARYLAGCLSRLVDVSSPLPGAGGAAEGGAAAGADLAAGSEAGDSGAAEGLPEQLLAFPPPAPRGPGLLPDADVLAALAAAGQPGSSKAAAPLELPAAARGGGGPAAAPAAAGPAIRADERVLLGAVLAEHLGPLCFERYAVEAVLVPLLDDVAGELSGGRRRRAAPLGSPPAPGSDSHAAAGAAGVAAGGLESEGEEGEEEEAAEDAAGSDGQRAAGPAPTAGGQELGRRRLYELLALLAAVLEPEELSALAATCCQVLARRVRGCVWTTAELPASAALSGLRLWSAILDCPPFLDAWLASGDWEGQLEQLLAVRQPSEDDLAELLHNLKVTWGEGGGVVSNRREDQSAFSSDLRKLTEGLEQVEAAHADLLLQVWLAGGGAQQRQPASPAAQEEAARAEEQGQAVGEEEEQEQQQQQQPAVGAGGEEEQAGAAGEQPQQAAGEQLAAAEAGQQAAAGEEAPAAAAAALSPRQQRHLPPLAPARQQPPAAQQAQQAEQQQEEEEEEEGRYLRRFLSYLLHKNHGAMRHVPPPGLSDQTALVSAVFALLRLMNEQVAAVLPEVPTLRWDPARTFLRGGPLGGGGDPYWDAGRMGGTLSHLAREHPLAAQDRRPLLPLAVGAVVKYDASLRLADRAAEGPSFADAPLRDRLLMLCHLSAAPLMRGGLRHLASMQAALQGIRALGGEAGGRLAEDTRRQYQQEFQRSLRAHEWAQCWLLSPWRQQAAFVLSVSTAQLLEALSEQRGELLRYVPELYVSTCLDMVHAVHRCEPAALDHAAMLALGLRHIVHLVVSHLEDGRIVSPEVQNRLLAMVLDGVQELDLLRELGDNEASRARLLPAMMRLFGRPQLWGHVYSFFALLVEGSGFLHPPAAFPPEFVEPLGKLRALFRATCLSDHELCARFTHHLFDSANRMLTELVSSLESMETSWTRGAGPSPQLLRLLASTADYALVLLRVIEMMAADMPELFLQGGDMNLTRLAEVFGFAVPQLVTGRAHRALQRVSAARLAQQLRLREAHLLQPLAGALVALWQAEAHAAAEQAASSSGEAPGAPQQLAPAAPEPQLELQPAAEAAAGGGAQPATAQPPAPEQPPAPLPRRRQSLLRALDRQAALTDGVLRGLLEVELAGVEPLSGDAHAADEHAPSPDEQRRAAGAQTEQLRQAVGWVLQHREAMAAAAAARAAGGAEARRVSSLNADELAEAPEEFLDPIVATLMQDPVTLPDSKVVVDRATIERHLLSSETDPFSRAPLRKEQLLPAAQLKARIEAWLGEHYPGGAHHLG